jgi:DNA primase
MDDEQLSIEDLRTAISCKQIVEAMGFVLERDKTSLREERSPSTHVWDDHWYDFGSGEHGDVIDLVMRCTECSFVQALRQLRRFASMNDIEPGSIPKAVERPVLDASVLLADMVVEASDAHEKALQAISGVDAGYLHMVLIPVTVGHAVKHAHGVKLRLFDGTKSSVPGSVYDELYAPPIWMASIDSPLVICEGESDAWAFASRSHAVASLPSGCGSWKDSFVDQHFTPKVYVCMDNDKAGRDAADRIFMKILKTGRDVEMLEVPFLYKDARQAFTNGWEPKL